MFHYSQKSQPYTTQVLTDPDQATVLEVVPERGGIVTRWCVQGKEVFYLDAERFLDPSLSVRGGIPLLFPICGNLPDNTYTHQGSVYTLKQHGFARELPWRLVGVEPGEQASLTLALERNAQTLASYPFEFAVVNRYLLAATTLVLEQKITNHSDEPMPFSSGIHPYFAVADKSQLALEIPGAQYLDQRTKQVAPYSGSFDFSLPEIDAGFRPLSAQQATVTDRAQGSRLTLGWDEAYTTLVFWTVLGKPFYCLEPWTAPRNSLNTGEDLLLLEPGASKTLTLTLDFKLI